LSRVRTGEFGFAVLEDGLGAIDALLVVATAWNVR
jgi:hypothetical protein